MYNKEQESWYPKWKKQQDCSHDIIIAEKHIMSNGQYRMFEKCKACEKRVGLNRPMVSDYDVKVASYKHPGKTLGDLYHVDNSYLKWIAIESHASDRIKKAAARILQGIPYEAPKEGDEYPYSDIYDDSIARKPLRDLRKAHGRCEYCGRRKGNEDAECNHGYEQSLEQDNTFKQ